MEDKKPQGTQTNATASKKVAKPTQAKPSQSALAKTVAKPKQSISANVTQPKGSVSVKSKQTVPVKSKQTVVVKPAQPKASVQTKSAQTKQTHIKSASTKSRPSATAKSQTANAEKRPQIWVKSDKASQTAKFQVNQPMPQKATPTNKVGSTKPKSLTSQKAIKPIPKPASTEPQATGAKKSIFARLISFFKGTPVTDAPAEKVANNAKAEKVERDAKADKAAKASKPKLSIKAWFDSKFKKKPIEDTPPQKVKTDKKIELKAADKEILTPAPADKRSAIAKLATKGFVVKSWQIAAAVVVVAVLVVGGVLLGTMLGNKDAKPEDPIVDYTGPIVDKDPENPSNITLPGYPVLMFPASSKKVTLELPNPKGNPCYFRYTLTIVETGDVLYESARIDPGKMVKDLTLNHALSAGTYTLRITIDTFSLDSGNAPMNGGVQEVKLIVK